MEHRRCCIGPINISPWSYIMREFFALLLLLSLLLSAWPFSVPKSHRNRLRRLNLTRIALESRLTNETTLNDLSHKLGVASPWNAPKFVWSWAFKLQRFILPIVHFFDKCAPADTCFNLPVLWWKAIAGNDIFAKTYDRGVAFDLLPHVTRWIVGFPFCLLYPRLHHQNVALRTSYLDQLVREELSSRQQGRDSISRSSINSGWIVNISSDLLVNDDAVRKGDVGHTCVITLGAGFDTRSIRLASEFANTSWFELDLPAVVQQKRGMFDRFVARRGASSSQRLPTLIEADLNNYTEVGNTIKRILQNDVMNVHKDRKRVLFLAEASILYLNQSLVAPLLQSCVQAATSELYPENVRFCFADRFPLQCLSRVYSSSLSRAYAVRAGALPAQTVATYQMDELTEFREAVSFLAQTGWRLFKWQVKPGRARHMGIAVAG